VGALAYELLTGRPPFTGTTAREVLSAHVTETAEPVTKHRDTVPPALAQLVMKCLEKKPADRWQSAEELLSQLEALATPSAGMTPTDTQPVAVSPIPKMRSYRVPVFGVAALILVVAVTWFVGGFGQRGPATTADVPMLAVLPFENLSAAEDDYFAAGITEEMTSRIAEISGLRVISRQSAIQYENSDKTLQQIGEELAVAYVLEGTIRTDRAPDGSGQVRVTPQLIRASDDAQLWTDRYTANLVPGEIFGVQEQIAGQVAEALDVTLLEPERRRLAAQPTANLEAYDYYLRGNDYYGRSRDPQDLQIAIQIYQKAVELDPDFALAYAFLSNIHSEMWWFFYDRTQERLAMAKEAVDKALTLDPDLPEAHVALGWYHYRGHLEYDRALAEFAIARKSQPNNSDLLFGIAAVQRRQGKWEQAAENMSKASDLNPRSAIDAVQAGITYLYMRDYSEAEGHFERAISLAPDQLRPYVWMARLYMTWQGDTAKVRPLLQQAERADPLGLDPQVWWHWALYRILDGASQQTLERLSEVRADSALYYSARAELYGLMNRPLLMRAHYDSARGVLESRAREQPDEARFHSELGLAYAGLGRKNEAIREGELAVELLPISKEALIGSDWVRNLAQIYVMVGDHDAAVEQLEYLFSIVAPISGHWLRLDPIWDPLRDRPRFRALLEERN